MYCPECGGEFRPGVADCPDCRVPLVETLPRVTQAHPDLELVTVFTAADPAAVLTAESLLAEAGVPFEKTGDGLQDLFGAGRLGTGFNILVGPVRFRVPEERAAEARELLEELGEQTAGDLEALEDG
jgi:hypothetical protein